MGTVLGCGTLKGCSFSCRLTVSHKGFADFQVLLSEETSFEKVLKSVCNTMWEEALKGDSVPVYLSFLFFTTALRVHLCTLSSLLG